MLPHLEPYWKDDFVFQDSSSLMTMLMFGYQKIQKFFSLKLSDTALILPVIPHRVGLKCNFVHDFANNAGR